MHSTYLFCLVDYVRRMPAIQQHEGQNHDLLFYEPDRSTTIKLHWRRTVVLLIFTEQIKTSNFCLIKPVIKYCASKKAGIFIVFPCC